MTQVSKDIRPQAIGRDEGTPMWFLGAWTLVRATAETTRGSFGLVEQVIPAGFASPFHVHHAEDETFYVIDGNLTLFCEGKKTSASEGAYIFLPRGIPHGFRVEGSGPARVLLLSTPGGGFEQFVLEMSDREKNSAAPPDIEKLVAVAAKYQIEILGPLPDSSGCVASAA